MHCAAAHAHFSGTFMLLNNLPYATSDLADHTELSHLSELVCEAVASHLCDRACLYDGLPEKIDWHLL